MRIQFKLLHQLIKRVGDVVGILLLLTAILFACRALI